MSAFIRWASSEFCPFSCIGTLANSVNTAAMAGFSFCEASSVAKDVVLSTVLERHCLRKALFCSTISSELQLQQHLRLLPRLAVEKLTIPLQPSILPSIHESGLGLACVVSSSCRQNATGKTAEIDETLVLRTTGTVRAWIVYFWHDAVKHVKPFLFFVCIMLSFVNMMHQNATYEMCRYMCL